MKTRKEGEKHRNVTSTPSAISAKFLLRKQTVSHQVTSALTWFCSVEDVSLHSIVGYANFYSSLRSENFADAKSTRLTKPLIRNH